MSKILESNRPYHDSQAWGSTTLKGIASKSILHAFQERTQTPSMILGGAIHCAILEPERFGLEYAIAPECDKRTKEGKEIWANFSARNANKTILTQDQIEDILGMKRTVTNHPIANMMLTGGEAEYSYYATNEEFKLPVKCRPDYVKNGSLIDLKTTQDASFEGFARQIGQFGYHLQAAYYIDVYNLATGLNHPDEFFLVAVENKAPYAVAVYKLDSMHIEAGRVAYKKAMGKLADFLARGGNPKEPNTLLGFGYPAVITDIQVPFYMLNKISNDEVA